MNEAAGKRYIVRFEDVGRGDVALVGGKNASLGEMVCALAPSGIVVPSGFATTAAAYWQFVTHNGLAEVITRSLTRATHSGNFSEAGRTIRTAFLNAEWPEELAADIRKGHRDPTEGENSVSRGLVEQNTLKFNSLYDRQTNNGPVVGGPQTPLLNSFRKEVLEQDKSA